MDFLFICRDALASSLVTNLALAMQAKEGGKSVGVLFSGEALSALYCGGTFTWPRELREQPLRLRMADQAAAAGLPVTGRGESRQIDIWKVLAKATEAQLPMFACPLWTGLLGLQEKLPPGVKGLDYSAVLKTLAEAKTVIGSL